MGTSAFDALWADDPKKPQAKSPSGASAFDAAWDGDKTPPPNVLQRGLSSVRSGLAEALTHPIRTAGEMLAAPVVSFSQAVAPSKEQAAELNKDAGFQGRMIARFGQEMPIRGVTGKERLAGVAQTVANVAAPMAAGPLSRVVGRTAAMALTGAGLGAAYNPDDPAAGAVSGAVISPAIGQTVRGAAKALEGAENVASKVKRIRSAPALDERALAQTQATEAADRANYGQAQAEGIAAGGSSPALAQALDHPRIKPYVEMVRASDRGQGATDAQIATEAYKLISRQRRGLLKKLRVEYDAKADLDAGDLANAAQLLRDATATPTGSAPAAMPSFPGAVAEHARMKGNRAVFNDAATNTGRVMRNTRIAPEKLDANSQAAWRQRIAAMTPEQAQYALKGTLSAANENMRPVIPSLKMMALGSAAGGAFGSAPGALFGGLGGYGASVGDALTRNALALSRISPYIDALDAASGRPARVPMNPDPAAFAAALAAALGTGVTSNKR